jgi:hypothetical protein
MVYTGFSSGAGTVYAPSVSKGYASSLLSTVIGIQNVGSSPVGLTVTYYNRDGTVAHVDGTVSGLQPGYSHFYDLDDEESITAPWNGTAVIESSGGDIVGSTSTLSDRYEQAFGLECLSGGAEVVYLPTAVYKYSSSEITAYVAVQNPNDYDVVAEVEYYDTGGNLVGSGTTATIPPGQKADARPSNYGAESGFLGSGIIKGYRADSPTTPAPVIAIVNLASKDTNSNYSFKGTAGGGQLVSLPFVQWGTSGSEWRTYVAVQNVGTGSADFTVTYYDHGGSSVHSETYTGIDVGVKANSRPSEFTSSDWSGGMEIVSNNGQPVQALVNVRSADGEYGGTYLGLVP